MAILNVQKITQAGIIPSFGAATAGGDVFDNGGEAYVHAKNGDTSDKTVTITAQSPCDQGFLHDINVTVSAGGEEILGPFPPHFYNDQNGQVNVSYDNTTSLTLAIFQL